MMDTIFVYFYYFEIIFIFHEMTKKFKNKLIKKIPTKFIQSSKNIKNKKIKILIIYIQ